MAGRPSQGPPARPAQATAEDLKSVLPMTAEVRKGHLCIGGVDMVLLCTPPGFRPMQFEAAVKAGKHVFMEKPVAVDAPGYRRVKAVNEEAKKKNLSVVSGLCLRCCYGFRELVRRIHDGALGEIHNLQANTPIANVLAMFEVVKEYR